MHVLTLPWLRPYARYATLVLRVVVGLLMAMHGYAKLTGGAAGVAGFFGSLGIPAPGIMAWVVIIIELVGGIMIILGLFTRFWAFLYVPTMAVAIVLARMKSGIISPQGGTFTFELELALLAGALALALLGSGPMSLDHMLGIDFHHEPEKA